MEKINNGIDELKLVLEKILGNPEELETWKIYFIIEQILQERMPDVSHKLKQIESTINYFENDEKGKEIGIQIKKVREFVKDIITQKEFIQNEKDLTNLELIKKIKENILNQGEEDKKILQILKEELGKRNK